MLIQRIIKCDVVCRKIIVWMPTKTVMAIDLSDSEWKTFTHLKSNYANESQRFVLPHRNFQRQYAHIYAARLWALRPKLQTAAARLLGSGVPVCR